MFRRSHPASRLSNTELKKLEHLFEMVDSCTVDMRSRLGQDTSRKLADTINEYPNATMVYEVMRRIRKCFKSGNPQVVLRALHLTDTLMQSCGAHARREVGSEKFLKHMGKLCKITKTRLDPSWQTVAERAQDLIEDWAEASEQTVGPGNRFTQTYLNLQRDGVQFRGASGRTGRGLGGARSSNSGLADYAGGGGRQFRLQGRGVLQPGDLGYDEEAELAAAIASSLGPAGPPGARGGMGLAASAENGELLSMVPPTIEALMDIMEGSRDLTELLDNEVAPDVVDQTRGLVEQVIKQVEKLESGNGPDEKDMDRYLKAHDDLQTVLRLYEGVLDGKTTLPLGRSGPVGGDAVATEGGRTETDMDEAFGGVGAGAGSSDDDSLVPGDDGGKGARSRRMIGSGEGADSGRGSPAKGNLLDLEENAPLAVGVSGEGMMVVYGGGAFNANNSSNNMGEVFGSGTTSNVPSETGAVYGSYNVGSNKNGGTNFGGQTHLTSGSGDSGAGFGLSDPFASFSPASGVPAPNAPAPGRPAPQPVTVSSFSRFGESQPSVASSNVPRGTPGQQSPSDFGTWISSVRGGNANGDAFGAAANGPGGGTGGGRQIRFQSNESTSFHSSNGGFGASPNLGPIAEMSPAFRGSGGGGNPFEYPPPATVGGGEGGGAGGFVQQNWPGAAAHGAGGTARSNDPGDPFSLGTATAFGGSRGPIDGGASSAVFYEPQQASTTVAAVPGGQSLTSSSSFPVFSPSAGPQQAPPPQPALSQQPQRHEQQDQWWQHPQQQQAPQRQPQPQQQDAADPFTGAILGGGHKGASAFGSDMDNDPFAQPPPQFQTQAPYSSSVTSFGGGGGGGVASGSFDSGSRGYWPRNSTDSTSSLVQGPTFASGGSGRSSMGGAAPPEQAPAGGNVALSQALVAADGGGIGGEGPFGVAPAPRKFNPFDDPEPAAPPVYVTPQQGPQPSPQQQQYWPQLQNLPQPPFQQAPQFQQYGWGGGGGQGNQGQGQGRGQFGVEPQGGFQQPPQQFQQQRSQQPQQQNFFA